MSKNTIGLPAESPEAIAERLLPHYSALHGIIAGCQCPCEYRPALAAALQAERERALEAASQAIADHIFTLPNGSLPWGLDAGIDIKGQLIKAVRRALAQKGGG